MKYNWSFTPVFIIILHEFPRNDNEFFKINLRCDKENLQYDKFLQVHNVWVIFFYSNQYNCHVLSISALRCYTCHDIANPQNCNISAECPSNDHVRFPDIMNLFI